MILCSDSEISIRLEISYQVRYVLEELDANIIKKSFYKIVRFFFFKISLIFLF
jgi:hypothetical protein